jgi:hypothetical protein
MDLRNQNSTAQPSVPASSLGCASFASFCPAWDFTPAPMPAARPRYVLKRSEGATQDVGAITQELGNLTHDRRG